MLYEHNGKLLFRTAEGYTSVSLTICEDGSYKLTPMGKPVGSRPLGATQTDVQTVVARYQLGAGSVFPAVEAKPQASTPKAQPKPSGSSKK